MLVTWTDSSGTARVGAIVRKTKAPVPSAPRHNPITRALVRLYLDGRSCLTSATLVGRPARSCFFSDMVVVVVWERGDGHGREPACNSRRDPRMPHGTLNHYRAAIAVDRGINHTSNGAVSESFTSPMTYYSWNDPSNPLRPRPVRDQGGNRFLDRRCRPRLAGSQAPPSELCSVTTIDVGVCATLLIS